MHQIPGNICFSTIDRLPAIHNPIHNLNRLPTMVQAMYTDLNPQSMALCMDHQQQIWQLRPTMPSLPPTQQRHTMLLLHLCTTHNCCQARAQPTTLTNHSQHEDDKRHKLAEGRNHSDSQQSYTSIKEKDISPQSVCVSLVLTMPMYNSPDGRG